MGVQSGYSRGTVVLIVCGGGGVWWWWWCVCVCVCVCVVAVVVVVVATNFYTKLYLHYRSSLDMSNKK